MNSSNVPFEVRFLNYINKKIERATNQEDLEDAKAILKVHKEMYKTTLG